MNQPREILARGRELRDLFAASGADAAGSAYMAPKASTRVLRVDGLKAPAANILKQEMLAMGGECVNHREVILARPELCTVHLIGSDKLLRQLVGKLAAQPFGLRSLAERVRDLLDALGSQPQGWTHARGQVGFEHAPALMGILNLTPDSFSDGGQNTDPDLAVSRALDMVEEGASLIDVGGESTRPGAATVSAEEELARVLPVIEKLAARSDVPISIDTRRAEVARDAIAAGAVIVNDVSALGDPEMPPLVAESGAGLVLMHMRGEPSTMQDSPHYEDAVDEIYRWLEDRVEAATAAGIDRKQLAVDPGTGFGKRLEDNTALLRRLGEFHSLGLPLLVGASRKSFLGRLMKEDDPAERLEGSLAAAGRAAQAGVGVLRVHDVAATRRFLDAWLPLAGTEAFGNEAEKA